MKTRLYFIGLAAVLLLGATETNAKILPGKIFQIGIKAGTSIPTAHAKKYTMGEDLEKFISSSANVGFNVGVMARVNILMFNVQSEIVYNRNIFDLVTPDQKVSKSQLHTIDIPLLAGVKFAFLRANLGPVFNIYSKSSISKGEIKSIDFTIPTVGYQVGIGADLWRFTIDARYQGNFSKTVQNMLLNDVSITSGNKANTGKVMLSLGYFF